MSLLCGVSAISGICLKAFEYWLKCYVQSDRACFLTFTLGVIKWGKAYNSQVEYSTVMLACRSQGQQTSFLCRSRIWDWLHHVAEGNARTPHVVTFIQTGTSLESVQAVATILPKTELRKQQNPW